MKNLKTYRMFESVIELTPEQVQWLDYYTNGTWTLNPQTGLIDIKGAFNYSHTSFIDFNGFNFGVVSGGFYCNNNSLTSLIGAPRSVGVFDCSNNALTSLEGAPQEVKGNFNCYDNDLTSLIGAPQLISGNFDCENNKLVNLIGSPKRVSGDFWCRRNLLTSLEGAPEYAGRFYSNKNPVSENSLENIYVLMQKGASYIQAVESLWNSLNNEDKSLLYRPEFKWVSEEELKGIKALIAFNKFKFIL